MPSELEERTSREREMRQIGTALHDLCQPLTTLQCRLEMAELVGTPEAYREAVETALGECGRLAAVVSSMRDLVRRANERAAGSAAGPIQ